ncbi:hypothetical protein [Rothia similmucilaginosa]|uniref:hypothetical protein n=1 Tax=Rothia sp. RSM42 TaxID=3030211 RepID=UPI002449B0D6|nr:hypothetical protein [Rothia sp. RSM42]
MTTNEENEFLRGIGKRNLSVIRQLAAGMHLGNVEVAITYDNCIDVKEFTIRGDLLPISPEMEEEERRKEEQKIRELLSQLKQK